MKATMLRVAAVAALALSANAAVAETITERLDDRKYFADGQAAWEKVCARCHTTVDDKTDQSVGPNLSPVEYDADTLKHFIRNGHLAMPAFSASHISDATIVELADYMAKNVFKGE